MITLKNESLRVVLREGVVAGERDLPLGSIKDGDLDFIRLVEDILVYPVVDLYRRNVGVVLDVLALEIRVDEVLDILDLVLPLLQNPV